jgi:hypothetical protein
MLALAGAGLLVLSPRSAKAQDGDLALVNVMPFHAAFGSSVFVKNKHLKVRVEIMNTFPHEVVVLIGVEELTPDGGPKSPPEDYFDSIHLQPGMNVVILPNDAAILGINSLVIGDDDLPDAFCFGVQVDTCDPLAPGCAHLAETDEGNNDFSSCVPYISTKKLRVLYIPLAFPDTDTPEPPTCEQMNQFAFFSSEYLRGTFPTADFGDATLADDTSCMKMEFPGHPIVDHGLLDAIDELNTLSWFGDPAGAYDMYVGVWHRDLNTGIGGLAHGISHHAAAVAENYSSGTIAAMEISHALRWAVTAQPPPVPGSQACGTVASPNNYHICELPAPGYWIRRQCPMGDFLWSEGGPLGGTCDTARTVNDFMHPSVESGTDVHRWISAATWDHLAGYLDTNCAHREGKSDFCNPDPPVIGIRGFILPDGTPVLKPWYVFESVYDAPLGNPGPFRVRYLDAHGSQIAETGFQELGEATHGDDPAPGYISLRVPFVEGTKTVIVTDDDGVTPLFRRDISASTPDIVLTKPRGGEYFAPGESVEIEWQAVDGDPGDTLTFRLLLSTDEGFSWLPVASELTETHFSLSLPPNLTKESLLFRVIATDGVNTSEDRSPSPSAVDELRTITIDIKPTSSVNTLNCTSPKSLIPVAVLSTDDFAATTIDPSSVRFGRKGIEAEEAHRGTAFISGKHIQDVNGDGRMDLILHFRFGETGLGCADVRAELRGRTFGGEAIRASDAVRMVQR